MKTPRKTYTPKERCAILRRHVIDKEPVSDICAKYQLQPAVFDRWMKKFSDCLAQDPDKKQERQFGYFEGLLMQLLLESKTHAEALRNAPFH